MDVIGEFIKRYTREVDFYEKVALRAGTLLDVELKNEGVQCAVTYRAKSIDRLEEKCRQREVKNGFAYGSVDDIYDDIVDLAGVRVALYFPSDRDTVASTINRIFDVIGNSKEFPNYSKKRPGNPRFSGYAAKHFRVRFQSLALPPSEKHHSIARIEIQIASVFMHGWSEVEHDLVYKPRDGGLSDEEYALLDQINGLAIAAEIALEGLQQARERRIAERSRKFGNHYELATHLLSILGISDRASVDAKGLGRMDYLFDLISVLHLNSPEKMDAYIDTLHDNFEARPLADQVVDALLAEDKSRYALYSDIRKTSDRDSRPSNESLGRFIATWIQLEQLENLLNTDLGSDFKVARRSFGHRLRDLNLLEDRDWPDLNEIRNMRNRIVHGPENYYTNFDINSAADELTRIINAITERARDRGLLEHRGMPPHGSDDDIPF
ncbi:hypothetical protein ACWFPY_00955 [Nocardia fluminea]